MKQLSREEHLSNQRWLRDNFQMLRGLYPKEYIAIVNKRVMAHEDSLRELCFVANETIGEGCWTLGDVTGFRFPNYLGV